MFVGGALFAVGLLFVILQKIGISKLPGDIVWSRGNFTLAFPIATSIAASIILTVILNIFLRK